ncbi:MAG: HupE/UreJ family protein [Gammaproteobacteria bacterium]
MKTKALSSTAGLLLTVLSGEAAAHPGLMEPYEFWAGFQHPWLGLDHLLVLSGLGLWLARQGTGFRRVAILVFLAAMALGAVLAMQGIRLGYVEAVILASVLLTGLLLLTAVWQLSASLGILLLGFVALMHGQAHGGEMPADVSVWGYVAGFSAATLSLQSLGWYCGRLLQRFRVEPIGRVIGGLTGLAGIWLLLNG